MATPIQSQTDGALEPVPGMRLEHHRIYEAGAATSYKGLTRNIPVFQVAMCCITGTEMPETCCPQQPCQSIRTCYLDWIPPPHPLGATKPACFQHRRNLHTQAQSCVRKSTHSFAQCGQSLRRTPHSETLLPKITRQTWEPLIQQPLPESAG